MPIVERQVTKRLNSAIRKILQSGSVPSGTALQVELEPFSKKLDGGPTYEPPVQVEKSDFDIISWNRAIDQLTFDFEVLYEEIKDQSIQLARRMNWSEASYRAQRGLLDVALSKLDDILFTTQNADYYLGISDTLNNMSNMDIENSTPNVQSLSERALLIPATALGTNRLNMEHMLANAMQPVDAVFPQQNLIVRNSPVSGAPFSNAFHDLVTPWRHDLFVKSDSAAIRVTFPLTGNDATVDISKVSIIPHSESKMRVTILSSLDNINFTELPVPGGSSNILLNSSAFEKCFDFPTTRARYIRLILSKDTPDEITDNGNRFSFGLKSISFYTVGRGFSATYQTIPLSTEQGKIEKVSIEAKESIPANTSIEYYLSESGEEWSPIAPIGRSNNRLPLTVNFGNSTKNRFSFIASSPELDETIKSVSYYQANSGEAISETPIFGSALLYRGLDCWASQSNEEEVVEQVTDTFIDFTSKDKQKLYHYVTLDAVAATRYNDYNPTRLLFPIYSTLTLARSVFYDENGGHLLVPGPTVDPDTDPQPKYAISKITGYRTAYSVTGELLTISLTKLSHLANSNIDPNIPLVVVDTVTTGELTENVHYTLGRNYITKAPNGTIRLISNTIQTESSINVSVDYGINKDLTQYVVGLSNDNKTILLDRGVTADRYEVKFRTVPQGGIIRSSIKVTERYGADGGTIYREGSDYTLNLSDGNIVKMSGGNMKSSCYVDFRYTVTEYELTNYHSWCYVDSNEPVQAEWSAISANRTLGEKFFININGADIDLTEAEETPTLTRGWYRFSVFSQDVTTLDSAIQQVLSLVDLSGEPIFSGNKYFAEIRAFRDPMRQTTELGLKYGVRKEDHSLFAINDDGYVITNFLPGSTDDLTTYRLIDGSLIEDNERFELVYGVSSQHTPTSILLKIVLRRNPTTDQAVTPKVFYWAIRISR